MGVTQLAQPVQEPAGHPGLNHGFPLVRRPDGRYHLSGGRILEQVALGSSLDAAEYVPVGGIGSQSNDSATGSLVNYASDSLYPVHLRHLEVHEDNIGQQLSRLSHCFDTIYGLTHHNQVFLLVQNRGETLPDYRVIVYYQDSDGFLCLASHRWARAVFGKWIAVPLRQEC